MGPVIEQHGHPAQNTAALGTRRRHVAAHPDIDRLAVEVGRCGAAVGAQEPPLAPRVVLHRPGVHHWRPVAGLDREVACSVAAKHCAWAFELTVAALEGGWRQATAAGGRAAISRAHFRQPRSHSPLKLQVSRPCSSLMLYKPEGRVRGTSLASPAQAGGAGCGGESRCVCFGHGVRLLRLRSVEG